MDMMIRLKNVTVGIKEEPTVTPELTIVARDTRNPPG